MKYLLICLLGLFVGCQTSPKYTLRGDVQGLEKTVYLLMQNEEGEVDTLNKAAIINGRFEMMGSVKEPIAAYLKFEDVKSTCPIFLENTDFHLRLNKDSLGNYILTGGYLQDVGNQFLHIARMYESELDTLRDAYQDAVKTDNLFGRMHVRALVYIADSVYERREDSLVALHNNIVSASILARRVVELQRTKRLRAKFDLLGDSARESVPGKLLAMYLEKDKNTTIGMKAPDFTQKTPDGKEVSLYSVKAKVKIVDFWASWCGPCRAENPHMRKVYEKYHPLGLEIIGVSLDSKKEAWEKAIETDQLEWIHVSDLMGWENSVAKLFGISSVPFTLVLNEKNEIVATNLRGTEIDECLDKMLNVK